VANISHDCGEIDRFMKEEISKIENLDYQHERYEMFGLSAGKDESVYSINYFPNWWVLFVCFCACFYNEFKAIEKM